MAEAEQGCRGMKCYLLSRVRLCNPMDCSPADSFFHGILQERIMEWVAFPTPGHVPNPGIEPGSPALPAVSLPF